ncbi:MAG: glycerol-3-phosphate acyltransferase [Calditrichae bacterium]|nr:glycerol-3-phosphate acyltransferase [Calditrichota bacterium]MCB9058239.1 glycerol-3-phosphate acyltransferase [Calditrichia bacterium]
MKIELYLAGFLVAYLFGSFPTAFILLKLKYNQDIRSSGSGNVGALNAMRSSKSKFAGLIVLFIDLLKGAFPVYLALNYFPSDAMLHIIVISAVVYGHCFPVWLRFQGGRGLATTAGALIVFNPVLVAIWLIAWIFYFILIRKHIVANLIATFLLPMIVFLGRIQFFNDDILLMILPVCMIILLRHLERVPDVIIESLEIKK